MNNNISNYTFRTPSLFIHTHRLAGEATVKGGRREGRKERRKKGEGRIMKDDQIKQGDRERE